MKNSKITLLIFTVMIFFLVNTFLVSACQCAEPEFQEAFQRATTVFAGNVIQIVSQDGYTNVTFNVSKVWKGMHDKQFVVELGSGREVVVCDIFWSYPFEHEKEYLVYASSNQEEKVLHTSGCAGTKLLENAQEDLAYLEKPSLPIGSTDIINLRTASVQLLKEKLARGTPEEKSSILIFFVDKARVVALSCTAKFLNMIELRVLSDFRKYHFFIVIENHDCYGHRRFFVRSAFGHAVAYEE